MVIGDLITLTNSQTSGYRNGTTGLIIKIEEVRKDLKLFWIMLPDDNTVPFWRLEFEVVSGSRRLDSNS